MVTNLCHVHLISSWTPQIARCRPTNYMYAWKVPISFTCVRPGSRQSHNYLIFCLHSEHNCCYQTVFQCGQFFSWLKLSQEYEPKSKPILVRPTTIPSLPCLIQMIKKNRSSLKLELVLSYTCSLYQGWWYHLNFRGIFDKHTYSGTELLLVTVRGSRF